MEALIHTLFDHMEFREGVHWQRRQLNAGEIVFREGDVGREVYLVLRGSMRVAGNVAVEHKRHIHPGICDLPQGTLFGELALFDRGPRSASVSAVVDSELAVIDGDRLLAFFDANPDLGYLILRELLTAVVGRMRATNKKLISIFAWGLKVHGIDRYL